MKTRMNESERISLGNRMRARMTARKVSAADLATAVGTEEMDIYAYAGGVSKDDMPLVVFARISRELNASPGFLLGLEDMA